MRNPSSHAHVLRLVWMYFRLPPVGECAIAGCRFQEDTTPQLRRPQDARVQPSYEHIMRGGPFAGQDPRDVVQQAIEWWRAYLDRVDARVGELIRSHR